uniref:Uncharacterized protein n=1 Tax=Candidatus Methanogaster sp. ANME-2c ERB4 TaxID=2759911 RepID=A0A7G9Y508_9EURY|nr:hypothetical protein FCAILLLB_00015 [Methanosarcinales archaeon ANME-2c ERB4]QNO43092.1 hypothetical protein DICHBKDE_00035 [Methanosarcinales archaeon ANME-2c ERB4]QNO43113.1 hypothetical protein PILMODGB_00004 [Methanosarcinales archaeon ANME-2c ERB4]QNO44344.1 hypothetical protein KIKEOHKK_00001 [Methanosarcinales archaeon ANME-2c ERB4]QNO45235.1 hypothetical protein GGLDAALA_00001 [Methanosarcinales archaeon ANME-2c ERB4]
MPFNSEIKKMLNKSWLYKAATCDRPIIEIISQEAQYPYRTVIAQSLKLLFTIHDVAI